MRDDFQDTEDLDGLFSGFDAAERRYDTDTWALRRLGAQAPTQPEHAAPGRTDARGRPAGGAPPATPPRDPTLAAPALRASRSCGATSRATRRRWSSAPAACRRELFLKVAEAILANSGPRAHDRLLLRRGLDPAHHRLADHRLPARCCNCCSATSGGRAAASWRCAATPPSRAAPTSRRSTTCCPATCPMPTHADGHDDRWPTSSTHERLADRLLVQRCRTTSSAC